MTTVRRRTRAKGPSVASRRHRSLSSAALSRSSNPPRVRNAAPQAAPLAGASRR
jgi:hypothetical protein